MSLNPCNEPDFIKSVNTDPLPLNCPSDKKECENQNQTSGHGLDWLDDYTMNKDGYGHSGLCDPMQKGYIINEQKGMGEQPNRNTVYRYSNAIRGCDEAVTDMFRDLIVIDEQGKAHPIPIIWGTQEKAVLSIVGPNFRKDNSLVVDRITLPMLAIGNVGIEYDYKRYTYHKALDFLRVHSKENIPGFAIREKYERDTVFGVAKGIPVNITYGLHAWTLYQIDMNQIIEQIMSKFSLMAYIKVKGISWEVGVKLESVENNIEFDPGDQAVNVFKYKFNIKAESFIPQPLTRNKSILKTRIELVDSTNDEDVTMVIQRLEEAVKGLK